MPLTPARKIALLLLERLTPERSLALARALGRTALLESAGAVSMGDMAIPGTEQAPPRPQRGRVSVREEEIDLEEGACVPNKSGDRHHDEDTGHPCVPDNHKDQPSTQARHAPASQPAAPSRQDHLDARTTALAYLDDQKTSIGYSDKDEQLVAIASRLRDGMHDLDSSELVQLGEGIGRAYQETFTHLGKRQIEALSQAGADPQKLGKAQSILARGEQAISRAAEKTKRLADKLAALQESKDSLPELGAEPEPPDPEDIFRELFPKLDYLEADEDGPERQKADREFDRRTTAYEKEHARWEKLDDRHSTADEKIEQASGDLDEAVEALSDAYNEHGSRLNDAVDAIQEEVRAAHESEQSEIDSETGPLENDPLASEYEAHGEPLEEADCDCDPDADDCDCHDAASLLEAGDEALRLFEAGEKRTVGDKWEGKGGRWFMLNATGRVVPTANPNKLPKGSGAGKGRKVEAPGPGTPARPGKQAKPAKKTADEVHARIAEIHSSGAMTAEHLDEIGGLMAGLTVPELKGLKARLGAAGKASLRKAELIDALKAKAKEMAKPADKPPATTATPPAPGTSPPDDHLQRVASAVLARQRSGNGLVSMLDLARDTGLSAPELHAAFRELRSRGVLTGSAPEGRHGSKPDERAHWMKDYGGEDIGYVSVRQGEEAGLAKLAAGTSSPDVATAKTASTSEPPVASDVASQPEDEIDISGLPVEGEPGFTGIDSLGRRWENGKLVAKPDDPVAPSSQAPGAGPPGIGSTPSVSAPAPRPPFKQRDPLHPVARAVRENKQASAVLDRMMSEHSGLISLREELKTATEKSFKAFGLYMKLQAKHGSHSPRTQAVGARWTDLYNKRKALEKQHEQETARAHETLRDAMRPRTAMPLQRNNHKGQTWFQAWIRGRLMPGAAVFGRMKPFVPTPEQDSAINAGIDFVRSVCEWTGNKNVEVVVGESEDGRAYYTGSGVKGSKGHTVMVGIGDDHHIQTKTMIHELGHLIEGAKPGAFKKIVDFVKYRTEGQKPVDMASIPGGEAMKGEKGMPDDFTRHMDPVSAAYVGKLYKRPWLLGGGVFATEVLSMGIEALYHDPVGFMHDDPEYAQFIIGVLKE